MSGLTATERLSAVIAHLIRPLVRLMLQRGVTYPQLIQLLRRVYVEVAENEFKLPGQKQTDSRLTLLTGIHRRYVKELRAQRREAVAMPANVSLGGQLVAAWLSDERFLDAAGRPLPLPRYASDNGPDFESLVLSVTTDLRARSILDELLRLGVVRLDEDETVLLEHSAFVPDAGSEEKLFFLGRNLHDHIAASVHNIEGGEPAFMERSAYNSELTERSATELAAFAEEEGMRGLRAVHRRAEALRARDEGRADAVFRVNFGSYFYSVSREEEEGQGSDDDAR